MENVKTINSAVRTTLMVGFLGVFVFLAYTGYNQWIKPGLDAERVRKKMAELQVKYEAQGEQLVQTRKDLELTREELVKTQTALKLVKVDQRKATIKVVETGQDEESGEPFFVVEFTEVDPDGVAISEPREFRLRGEKMYVDSWVVKFEDKFIEQADELRAASLCVFKAIWGDLDQRAGGQSLDTNSDTVKTAYGTLDPKSDFEQQIWDDFWALANDTDQQAELGIRAAHGQVNYIKIEPGMIYEVDLRASDGATLKPSMQTHNTSIRLPN